MSKEILLQHLSDALKWALKAAKSTSVTIKATKNDKILEYSQCNSWLSGNDNKQYTTKLGEDLVMKVLKEAGKNPRRCKRKDGLEPDIETDDCIYEVKTRNYVTTGTAGEKVLGTPLKYCEVYKKYQKPLVIVLVAYQEVEYTKGKINLIDPDEQSPELRKILEFFKKELNVTYMTFSQLVTQHTPELLQSLTQDS
jgi:hypothetical protein